MMVKLWKISRVKCICTHFFLGFKTCFLDRTLPYANLMLFRILSSCLDSLPWLLWKKYSTLVQRNLLFVSFTRLYSLWLLLLCLFLSPQENMTKNFQLKTLKLLLYFHLSCLCFKAIITSPLGRGWDPGNGNSPGHYCMNLAEGFLLRVDFL